ncbi:MAG TPA: TolC family protein [Gemmataceae bacterium]|jgi:hypothetical protein
MRRLAVNTLALALALAGVSISLGQQTDAPPKRKVVRVEEEEEAPKAKAAPTKSKLEEMLAEALKNNPDIRVAAAKVAKADAELNRTRLQVAQKIVELYNAIDAQKKTVALQEQKSGSLEQRFKEARIPFTEVLDARQAVTLAKAKLAELEAQMPALLGKTAHAADAKDAEDAVSRDYLRSQYERFLAGDMETTRWFKLQEQRKATGPLAERIRKALETPVAVNYKDVKFSEILKDLEKKAPGLPFHIRDLPMKGQFGAAEDAKVTLHFDMSLPIAAILQAIEDDTGAHFIVRDYGILVTTGKLPPGALTVQEFLRQKPADVPRSRPNEGKNPPPQAIEGTVKAVDPGGLMTISIGSDSGLTKGHTLELFRLNPAAPTQSRYLGTVRILEVGPKESVVQPVGRLAAPPRVGDQATSHILGK